MDDLQQYQINCSVPKNSGSKTKHLFYKFTRNEANINEETLANFETSANLTKLFSYISLYCLSLGQYLAATDHFSM